MKGEKRKREDVKESRKSSFKKGKINANSEEKRKKGLFEEQILA
jgi:hypothetical protein